LYAGLFEGISTKIVREMGLALGVVVAPVVFWSSIPFHRGAWQSIRTRRLSLDLLVSVSILAGYFASLRNSWLGVNETYFDAVAMLASFLLGGRLITRLAEERVQAGGEFLARELAGEASPARVGDVLEVASGEIFPGDGFVRSGTSTMNAAWLTGEEEPVAVSQGDRIWAGAVNLQSALTVEIESVGRDTRMGRILSMLSGVGKGPLQKISRRVESAIVGSVLLVVAAVVAWGAYRGSVDASIIVATLLVACPCAVGLAVPAVLGVAHRQAAGRRILLKGVDAFERVAEADIVVFDKTGTLTRAIPVLRDEIWQIDDREKRAWEPVLGALCRASAHLVLRPLRERFPDLEPGLEIGETAGSGLETVWKGAKIRLGRAEWAVCAQADIPRDEWTEVVMARDGIEIARFTMESKLRQEAPEVVKELSHGRET
ncbi:MAG: HAD-IC family P-type ATPase, partial [Fibrobacterota bacterium]